MWVCVHDPADANKVEAAFAGWPKTHWEYDFTRHGSPLLEKDVLIVSGGAGNNRFPLFRNLESADFVLFYVEGKNPDTFGPGQHLVSFEELPIDLQNLSEKEAVVAIELTSQNPANSNAVQRFGRYEDHAALGIPFLIASPIESARLDTAEGIAGGHGDRRLKIYQRQLIQQNQPTTKENLSGLVVGGCPFDERMHPMQGISQWTEQYLMVLRDSFRCNMAHLTLPRMWSCIHDSYRYSGSQLSNLYEFIRKVMDDTEKHGIISGRNSNAWDVHVKGTASRAENGGQGRGTLADMISTYGQYNGFTVGSIKIIDQSFTHQSKSHHYLFRANQCTPNTPYGALRRGGECIEHLQNDALSKFCLGFNIDRELMKKLAVIVKDRHLLITRRLRTIRDFRDTYAGGTAVTDWLFTRKKSDHWDISKYPRAVSTSPADRVHLYGLEGTFNSHQVIGRENDVYGRRILHRMDLFRCSDGVFIGKPIADALNVPFMTPLAR